GRVRRPGRSGSAPHVPAAAADACGHHPVRGAAASGTWASSVLRLVLVAPDEPHDPDALRASPVAAECGLRDVPGAPLIVLGSVRGGQGWSRGRPCATI